ncbi:hypothetical protein NHG32_07330 [Aerococcaceae bacterium NML191219]|nr:hypothetical protein [Aerococcaceae bacterium NML191219]
MIDKSILELQWVLSDTDRMAIFNLFDEMKKENQGGMSLALLAVYHAGRIEGIRQERRKKAQKKAKEQARVINRNAFRQYVGREPKNDEEVATWVNELVASLPKKRVPILKEYRKNDRVVRTEWV